MAKRTKLIEVREAAGLTQVQTAQRLGIAQSHYTMIETGERNPSLALALRISHVFGVPLEVLFFDLANHTS